jgi:hypothetical protein
MTKAVMHDTGPEPVAKIGFRLSGLNVRGDKLEKMAWKLAKNNDQRRIIERVEKAVWTEFCSIQDHIVAILCTTLAGAAVHMMLAGALNDICATNTGCEDVYPQIDRALRAVMRVVADAAALDMKTVGTDFYAADYTGLYPTVAVE